MSKFKLIAGCMFGVITAGAMTAFMVDSYADSRAQGEVDKQIELIGDRASVSYGKVDGHAGLFRNGATVSEMIVQVAPGGYLNIEEVSLYEKRGGGHTMVSVKGIKLSTNRQAPEEVREALKSMPKDLSLDISGEIKIEEGRLDIVDLIAFAPGYGEIRAGLNTEGYSGASLNKESLLDGSMIIKKVAVQFEDHGAVEALVDALVYPGRTAELRVEAKRDLSKYRDKYGDNMKNWPLLDRYMGYLAEIIEGSKDGFRITWEPAEVVSAKDMTALAARSINNPEIFTYMAKDAAVETF